MGKYGTTAVRAAELLRNGYASADEAWREIAAEVFSNAPEAEKKVCPREAFFGLCEAGLIKGVLASTCRRVDTPSLNRGYSVAAARLLVAEGELATGSRSELWRRVMSASGADPGKKHNSQMDVVLALWNADLIDPSAAS
jgi:hypothetical protein